MRSRGEGVGQGGRRGREATRSRVYYRVGTTEERRNEGQGRIGTGREREMEGQESNTPQAARVNSHVEGQITCEFTCE